MLSPKRDLFEQATTAADPPKKVVTDGIYSYRRVIREAFIKLYKLLLFDIRLQQYFGYQRSLFHSIFLQVLVTPHADDTTQRYFLTLGVIQFGRQNQTFL